jgi:undecaprenyl pyrophosphate synthase
MLSFPELLSVIGLLLIIVTMWVKLNTKVADIIRSVADQNTAHERSLISIDRETEIKLKGLKAEVELQIRAVEQANNIKLDAIKAEIKLHIESIKSSTKGLSDFFTQRIVEFVADNKGDHEEISSNVKKLFDKVNDISISVAKISKEK